MPLDHNSFSAKPVPGNSKHLVSFSLPWCLAVFIGLFRVKAKYSSLPPLFTQLIPLAQFFFVVTQRLSQLGQHGQQRERRCWWLDAQVDVYVSVIAMVGFCR